MVWDHRGVGNAERERDLKMGPKNGGKVEKLIAWKVNSNFKKSKCNYEIRIARQALEDPEDFSSFTKQKVGDKTGSSRTVHGIRSETKTLPLL